MKWCDFYDNYYDWADSTRKTRISSLEDMGPGDEIVEVVLDIEDPKVRAQLLNKAMKLGAVFSREDFADLDGELPAELYEKLGDYTGFDHTDPHIDEDNMTWDDFYFGHAEWDEEKVIRRIGKLRHIGPATEVCTVVRDMENPQIRARLISKAMELKVVFDADDFAELDGELPPEQYEKLGKYAGFDPNDPYFDEDNMTWDDFYCAYSDWDIRVLTRRLAKLKDFGPVDEVCEVIGDMPTGTLENLLYRKAGMAGVPFTREHLMQMGRWDDVLHDITTHDLSDENIARFVENAKTVVEEAEYLIENEEKLKRKAKREKRWFIFLAAVIGILSGIQESWLKKRKR